MTDAPQHVREEGGVRALLAGGADLLIVKDAQRRKTLRILRLQKALQAAEHALQIVQPGRGDEFLLRAPKRACRNGVEKQIPGEDILFLHAKRPGNKRVKTFRSRLRQKRQHIHMRLIGFAVVGLAVHVDRKIGDQRDGTLQVDKAGDKPSFRAQRHASRRGKGTVQPGGAEHPAVFFHIQPHIAVRRGNGSVFLDLEGGRIAVRRGKHQPGGDGFGDAQRDERRAVAPHKDFVTGLYGKIFRLIQLAVARGSKGILHVFHSVEGAGGAGNKRKKLRIEIHRSNPHFVSIVK